MDREEAIQEIAAALTILEKCSDEELESVKRFLQCFPDNALQDMRDKHRKALEDVMVIPGLLG